MIRSESSFQNFSKHHLTNSYHTTPTSITDEIGLMHLRFQNWEVLSITEPNDVFINGLESLIGLVLVDFLFKRICFT